MGSAVGFEEAELEGGAVVLLDTVAE